jgi:phosphoribosyl 1,2-cyclic phosphodiesterase
MMRVHVVSTGSSGNAIVVEADGTRLLVEAGVNPKHVVTRMRTLGHDMFPRGVDGIVVTHHHNDHAAQLEPLCKSLGVARAGEVTRGEHDRATLHLHDGIDVPRVRHRYAVRRYRAGGAFHVRDLRVRTLTLAHDAPHVALAIQSKTHTLGFVTDVGSITHDVIDFLSSCDTVLLESNFCPELLQMGPYPPSLRRRIAGNLGHLSNAQAAALAGEIARGGTSNIFLCHLSQVNNEPHIALRTVRERARDATIEVLGHGHARTIDLAPRVPRASYEQLPLF